MMIAVKTTINIFEIALRIGSLLSGPAKDKSVIEEYNLIRAYSQVILGECAPK